jgi:hypothetical protein
VYSYPFEGGKGRGQEDCGCTEDGGPQPLRFKAMLNDVAPGARLRIVKRGETVWERRAPKELPALEGVRATLDKAYNLAETETIELPAKPPAVAIFLPRAILARLC